MKRPHDYSSPDSDTDEFIDVGQEDSYCAVTGSMSPGSASQVLARKKRRGIIEKRRRDRINHSLSELRRLVPSAFEKQGSSKLEKAEILQMTVDHLKLLHAMGGKGYFDARALAVDYRTLGFRECVGEVVRYLSSLEGDSADPIAARLVSHLSHCASELDPLLLQPAPASAVPFAHWHWPTFPPLSPAPPTSSSPPFHRRDLALLGAYSPPVSLRLNPPPPPLVAPTALTTSVPRVSSLTTSPLHRGTQPPHHSVSNVSPRPLSPPASTSVSTASSSPPAQASFRPFAPLGSPTTQRRGVSVSSKSSQAWGTEIGAF
ncbi:hairy/enhancer-of-split related with YRPW motif-like protein [Boleophthalmus pectinirostris]|uniref:hairy/enhancer-of-split related with YRPW motif-like protein n=1 Tax=Boleophthalmus pectinirostris TaxID=150288 RepID=UPI000A1C3632|nr:hairy/enhancer-of-split related with YRPW motif-like protein [Boleophthalmus pectinirostris]